MNIVVTGGTSGIGLGIVKRLLRTTNARIISLSKDIKRISEIKMELKNYEDRLDFYAVDLSNENFINEFVKKLESKYEVLDGLVNSAGIISPGDVEQCSFEDWRKVFRINLDGPFLLTKGLIPLLKKSKNPSIVNISSVNSIRCGSSIAYSTSKAAVDMMTKSFALSLAQYGIRANAVNPGVVVSNLQMSAGITKSKEEYEKFLLKMEKLHPLGRVGLPEDIAGIVCFLLSEDSKWMTGAIISVDGGRAI